MEKNMYLTNYVKQILALLTRISKCLEEIDFHADASNPYADSIRKKELLFIIAFDFEILFKLSSFKKLSYMENQTANLAVLYYGYV